LREHLVVLAIQIHDPFAKQEHDMKTRSMLALLLAGSFGAIGGAAEPGDMRLDMLNGPDMLEMDSETVRYDAMQIRDEKSAERLFFRIRQAADEVCRISPTPRGYEIWFEHDCAAAAVERAVENADVPALDEYYFDE
jgi:UrcA family protein